MASLFLCANGPAFVTPHPVVLYEKGEKLLLSASGNPRELTAAKKVFQSLIARYPDSPLGYLGMSGAVTDEALLYGTHYNMQLLHDEALPFAVKALELGPLVCDNHTHYADLEAIFARYFHRKKEAQVALTLSPDNPRAFYLAAVVVLDQNDPQKALEFLSMALDMKPPVSLRKEILERLAWIQLHIYRQFSQAVDYYRQALIIDPGSAEDQAFLGTAYFQLEDYAAAAEALAKSLQLRASPEVAYQLLLARAYNAEKQGATLAAIQFLEEARQTGRQDVDLQYKLGNLYFGNGEYQKAYDLFRKVIDLQPDVANAYFYAGRAVQSLGRGDLAVNYFAKFLTFGSDEQKEDWIRQNIPDLSRQDLNE